jgi:AcrR family transcriptional regulator
MPPPGMPPPGMPPLETSQETGPPEVARRRSSRSSATRSSLVEAASELFAERGYGSTSLRDVAYRANLTTGAIYGQFRNKADLLAEAIGNRISDELDAQCQIVKRGASHVEALASIALRYRQRRRLRALILQGAAAAQTDRETREKLRDEQMSHLRAWIGEYDAHRESLGIDPGVDLQSAVLYTWAAEVGLGVLEVFGITPDSDAGWADLAARVGRSLRLPADESRPAPPRQRVG